MDLLVVILGAALVVGAVFVLVWALTSERELGAAQSNLGRGGMPTNSRQIALSASAKTRILDPFFDGIARRGRGLTSAGMGDRVQRKLDLAGLHEKGWTVERVVVIRFLSMAIGAVLVVLLLTNGTGRQSLGLAQVHADQARDAAFDHGHAEQAVHAAHGHGVVGDDEIAGVGFVDHDVEQIAEALDVRIV